jgi:hypothetical protein
MSYVLSKSMSMSKDMKKTQDTTIDNRISMDTTYLVSLWIFDIEIVVNL